MSVREYSGINTLRDAVRTLARRPRLAIASVTLLALGVGANAVLFSIADAVMFRPFPFADQGRLVIGAEQVTTTRAEVSYANFKDWQARSRAFDGLAAMTSSNWTMTLRASTRRRAGHCHRLRLLAVTVRGRSTYRRPPGHAW